MSWPMVTLGDICELKYGKSLPESARDSGQFRVFGSNGPVGQHSIATTTGPTIIVGRKGSLGEVNFSDRSCWPIDTTYYIDSGATRANLRWLYHLLRTLKLNGLNRAAAVPGLNRQDAYRKAVFLPPLEEQRRIAATLDKAEELRAKRRAAIALLDELPQAIFLEMFGEPTTNPKAWPVSSLSEVGEAQGGLMVTTARRTLPEEAPYLRVANVLRGCLDLAEIKTIRATKSELERTSLLAGDLLVVEGHGNKEEIGRVAVWDGSIPRCVHQNHIIRVRLNRAKALPAYASHFLNSPGGRRVLLRSGKTTSGLNTISVSDVRRTPVLLPPIDLQYRFAHRIDQTHRAKATVQTALTELDVLFASLQDRFLGGP